MFVIDQLVASISSGESCADSLAMLPNSAREGVSNADLQNRMVAVCDDINPKVIITRHEIDNNERCLDFARHDRQPMWKAR